MVGVIKNKNTYLIYLFCLIIAAAVITICSQSSPFYPLNTWVDPNCFLTVGKGIIHGLVPYRDLIEQKGPFLYFLHAGAALISGTSFLGVWILEIVICSFFLYFSYKIIELYNKKLAIYFIPLIAVLCFTTPAFRMGDSAEELALPFITYAMYVLLKSYKTKEEITNTQYFFVGLTAGCIFWSKFTLVGFYFGWFLGPLIHYIKSKNPKALLKSVLYIVFGVTVSTIPWIIYFGITHSMSDFIDVYLVKNLTSYPLEKTDGESIKILRVIKGGIESAWRNNKANLIALGIFIPLAAVRKNFKEI